MEKYDNNVALVLSELVAKNYSHSVMSTHRICYKELRDYLRDKKTDYSSEIAYGWLYAHRNIWNHRKYTSYRHCIEQLNDICSDGCISLAHMGSRSSAYALLSDEFKTELNDFLSKGNINSKDDRYRICCSRFLLYLQNRGIQSVMNLDYENLFSFHNEDFHRTSRSKDAYEAMIRRFLMYYATQGKCSIGLSLALNKMLFHQILIISNGELTNFKSNDSVSIDFKWFDIESFLQIMSNARYGSSVLKSTKHILSLCYIFFDMHDITKSERNLWLWFEHIKQRLGSGWKQHRRSLCQFLHYLKTGEVITSVTGNPARVATIDKLPSWSKNIIYPYLDLLKREGLCKSTIAMHRSSCIRLCQYLHKIKLRSFQELSANDLAAFNAQDLHTTPEGKAAYNCRIRCFLIYLYEENLIQNPYLYRALPTTTSPRVSIVNTLSEEEVASVWSVNPSLLSPKSLRDYAMVCIGLTMGFRASDIVALRFDNINWKQRYISLVQQKTGKFIRMPMPVKTGNILFQYLRDGRPKSSDLHIFIRHEAPYDGLHRSVCAHALNRFLPCENRDAGGFHVVRKTFATGLLKGSTKLELISDSLGHSTDDTVHKYLSLDEERMRQCPISMMDVGIELKVVF